MSFHKKIRLNTFESSAFLIFLIFFFRITQFNLSLMGILQKEFYNSRTVTKQSLTVACILLKSENEKHFKIKY